jgi:hypothetical protein
MNYINSVHNLDEKFIKSLYSLCSIILDTFDENKNIIRYLWGICKNTQLGLDPDLNKLSNELFCIQNELFCIQKGVNQKIW